MTVIDNGNTVAVATHTKYGTCARATQRSYGHTTTDHPDDGSQQERNVHRSQRQISHPKTELG